MAQDKGSQRAPGQRERHSPNDGSDLLDAIPLPRFTAQLLGKVPTQGHHPGLILDKYLKPAPTQEHQKKRCEDVARIGGDAALLEELLKRRNAVFTTWERKTATPLTIHLARASVLENAGLCLHPVYGFAYLPGSGLKGMARAYAETVWLAAQPADQATENWRTIERVFGWAPNSDFVDRDTGEKPWKPAGVPKHREADNAAAGRIVFHDAWPTRWPRLIVDIVNNHHPEYYLKGDPPGDWENPKPVYFLAIPAGQEFSFALSKRRDDVPEEHLQFARQWLDGALTHLGCGAKTNTGYGYFAPVAETSEDNRKVAAAVRETWTAATDKARHASRKDGSGGIPRLEFTATLDLVTPAFLAGAGQFEDEGRQSCDLRPATLRGQLRWWWRTMHAGHVSPAQLRQLEADVWGDTEAGGAVQLTLAPQEMPSPCPFDKSERTNANKLPKPLDRKTTQGLWYHSYGMDERKGRRWYIEPGARWKVTLVARGEPEEGLARRAELRLAQAKAALWLLCTFGGVGAKSRKGFGCFAVPQDLHELTIDSCHKVASEYRQVLFGSSDPFDRKLATSPALSLRITEEIPLPWRNVWFAIDRAGDSAQSFAKGKKHHQEKKALGLPRNVIGQGTFKPGPHVVDRHASPIHYHFSRNADGTYKLRILAFPAAELPDLQESERFLKQALTHVRDKLQEYARDFARDGQTSAPSVVRPVTGGTKGDAKAVPQEPPGMPKAGDRVDAELLAEKTKKGGWKAKHISTGIAGPIINSSEVPSDKKPGDHVTMIVQAPGVKEISFRWPTAADEEKKPKRKPQDRPPIGGGYERRR